MRIRSLLLLGIALCATFLHAGPRHRAAGKPVVDLSTPAGWLGHYGRVVETAEPVPYSYDLDLLRTLVGDAAVVGLGDGTHGTHEFTMVKTRLIHFLATEKNFDVVAIEGPFHLLNRINAYVQGEGNDGDGRALVAQMIPSGNYGFWQTAEFLQVVEWMRGYNQTRGARPAIEIAGADIFDEVDSAAEVVAYLRGVDPVSADAVQQQYASCISCFSSATIRNELAAREAELVPRTSYRAFHDALQHAEVVAQRRGSDPTPTRDRAMARNVQWMRTHRGQSGKVIFWAHNEHVGEINSSFVGNSPPAGRVLHEALGEGYFSLATLTRSGTFRLWTVSGATAPLPTFVQTFPAVAEGASESYFRQHGAAILLIELPADSPAWLSEPRGYNAAGSGGGWVVVTASLPAKFDALLYFEATTPVSMLP